MFGEAGRSYVYFTYGMHWMLNAITGEKGYPAAILIRGTDAVSGPARLTKFLKIDKKLNDKALGKAAGLWIEDRGVKISKKDLIRTPRIGIPRAEEWVDKPYRFLLKDK
jgi:DNA-3-methyladenine glycosylase